MKRDWNEIKNLLLILEDEKTLLEVDVKIIEEYISLLEELKLIEYFECDCKHRLTSKGHDLLEIMKHPILWAKLTERHNFTIYKKGEPTQSVDVSAPLTVDLIFKAAERYVLKMIGVNEE